mmetsp:Transcript_8002/g.23635  ORF Transcript_8002/g.23635 Transcript_8002/m.23635 type:complete len:482 (-) Transcript_8002:4059-5504(-)
MAAPCSSVEAPSSSSSPSSRTLPVVPATLNSSAPSSSMEDWRMRQLRWAVPCRMAGSSSSRALREYRSTSVRPAASAALRTPSASSASPPSTAGSMFSRCTCTSSGTARGRNLKRVSAPSRSKWRAARHDCRMSGSSAARWSGPSTASTSARPCAAPDLSTPDPSERRVASSQGTSSVKCWAPMPRRRDPRARAAVARTSGSGSTTAACSSGISSPTYGAMSLGSLMRAHMLPTMRAALRLASPERSRSPRATTGTISARLAASTVLMNTVSSNTSRVGRVCLAGSAMADSRVGTSTDTSGFLITDPTSWRAVRAEACTLGWGSDSTVDSRGTIVGSAVLSCLGAQYAMAPSIWMDPCLVRHRRSSTPVSSAGSTSFTPWPERWDIMAREAASVASRTPGSPSPKHASSMGKMWITYGSNSRPSLSTSASKANNPPSRAAGLLLFSRSALRASIMPCPLSAVMPSPFTTPAIPYAPPLLSP